MDQTIKVGIVGVGNMGSAHAGTILAGKVQGMQLAALCDFEESRRILLQKEYDIPIYSEYSKMLDAVQLDALIVATPHYSHCEIAEDALRRGLHVLVEKPIGVRLSDAQRLARTANSQDKLFCIMFNQRTNQLFAKTKQLVEAGALGRIKRSVWLITNWYRTQAYYDSGSWRATWGGEGGGVLMNQAPHNLDLWQWILGMPSKVSAQCEVGKYHNIEVEDDAVIHMEYPDGATGLFITSTGEYPGTNRFEISGTGGKLVLENGVLKLWSLHTNEETVRFADERLFATIPYDYQEFEQEKGAEEEGHLRILQNFSNAIRSGEKLISPGVEGVHEITLANAAYLSSWLGRPVALPFDTDLFDAELEKRIALSIPHKTGNVSDAQQNTTYSDRWKVRW